MKRNHESGALGEERCWLKFALDRSDIEEGTFRGIASVFGSMVQSWVPTVIERGAFTKTLQENGSRVKLLWQHDAGNPIGLPMRLRETDTGLEVEGRISRTTLGKDALTLMRDGVIDELSIGFDPIVWEFEDKGDGSTALRHIKELRLWEISLVTFAADPLARVHQVHSVVPFQDLPLADEARPWDKGPAMKRIRAACAMDDDSPNWAKFRRAHVWYDNAAPEKMGSYKLLIADIIDDRMLAVPRAVFVAAVVQGGRGGLDIPDSELGAVKSHLGRYYAKMDRTPPWEAEEDSLRTLLEPIASLPTETQQGFQIQTLIFPKSKWDSVDACRTWLREHDFKAPAVDETEDSWRFRQREPGDFERLRTICINPGRTTPMTDCKVKAVGGPLKEGQALGNASLADLAAVPLEAHEGRVLSAKNRKLLQDAVAALQALIAAAEPPAKEEEQALTAGMEEPLDQLSELEMWLARL